MKQSVSKPRQAFLLVIAALLACAVGFTVVGCGPSDEDQVRDAVTNELDLIKNQDAATIEEVEGSVSSQFTALGIDSSEFIGAWLDGFDYSIDSVTVDGDSATATVTVTAKQLVGIINSWSSSYQEEIKQNASNLDYSSAMQQAGSSFMDALNAAEPTTTTVTLPLQKSDNQWTLTSDASDAFSSAIVGDTSTLN